MPEQTKPRHDLPEMGAPEQKDGHWVFAYGSLIWNPGFSFVERCEARLIGAHRALCVYSHHHRGTPEAPGLVLGLEQGGSCHGVAYRVAAENWPEIYAYLTEREQISGVYVENRLEVELLDGSQRHATALAYLANCTHEQYAGTLTREEQLHLVRRSHGRAGPNADYVTSTVEALHKMGINDDDLNWIVRNLV